MEPSAPTPSSQKLAAALAAAQAASVPVRFPGEDGGHSLAEMAQRDLDAALQLLADRAQYITGASGAAIALRREGRNDMLCRASTGSIAPELGALLSTEFGLSGESVRTRQLLRCDDAERDARVNREVCRQLGIASVLVMPVVNDDHVLGVFELFSGKANAFGERDLSAVQRLSEMVETAVRLAHATEALPEQLKEQNSTAADAKSREGQFVTDLVLEAPAEATVAQPDEQVLETEPDVLPAEPPQAEIPAPAAAASQQTVPQAPQPAVTAPAPVESMPQENAKKTLFWSAELDSDADTGNPAETDQGHVPPVLRGLHKCVACGFPVSAGRLLCVECEEKKWRGLLRRPARPAAAKAAASASAPAPSIPAKPAAQAFAAAALSMAAPVIATPPALKPVPVGPARSIAASPAARTIGAAPAPVPSAEQPQSQPASTSADIQALPAAETPSPELILSAALPPSQSWLSRNKYTLGVLLAIAGAAAAVFFLR